MLKVKDVMHNPVISIEGDRTLYDAAVLMEHRKIGSLIIREGQRPVGILTERDFIRLIAKEKVSASSLKVVDMMTKSPITVNSESTVDEAGELMARYEIRRLPVVEEGNLVGIVTNRDILLNMLEGIGYDSVYA